MASNKKVSCSFCGRSKADVGMLLSGIDGHICDSCIQQGFEVIKEEFVAPVASATKHQFELVKPKDLKAYLDEYVIGQEEAVTTRSWRPAQGWRQRGRGARAGDRGGEGRRGPPSMDGL
jgi:ATP-dependent Clp protease ATP-binding subunit ClpX